jgi:hypothetical protein
LHNKKIIFIFALSKNKMKEIERNIGLTFDFVNHLIDNQSELDKLPDNFRLEFVEKDFPQRQSSQIHKPVPQMQSQFVQVKNSFAFA